MNSLVTVYITNYNYSKYIEQSIKSVLNQSYKNIELIIIDDGSTDGSKGIIEKYRGEKNISIIYQQNKGLNITNNIALKASYGDYIVRLDADDYFTEDAVEVMVNHLDYDQELGLVFPDYYYVDEKGEVLSEFKRLDFDNDVTLLDLPAHGACTMIRTKFLRAVGGYNESYNCQDGYELWVKFTTKFKVNNISKSLFYYRRHGENLTNNEEKILSTRFNIKNDYVKGQNINIPKTLCVIPIRDMKLKNKNLALHKISDQTLLDFKMEAAKESRYIDSIVVSSSCQEISVEMESKYSMDASFIERPKRFGSQNLSITVTLDHILKDENIAKQNFDSIVVLSVEFPFLKAESIDESILTASIFDANSCISVRTDDSIFYQHHGNGLIPILNREKYTRLEREALFKSVGGLYYSSISGFNDKQSLLNGKVGHVVIDRKASMDIHTEFDLQLANYLHTNGIK